MPHDVRKLLWDARDALDAVRDLARRIPELRRAVDFRNVLIHSYSEVDPELVWRISVESSPLLRAKLDELLHDV